MQKYSVSEEEYQKALSNTKAQPSQQTEKTPNKVHVEIQDGQQDQGQMDAPDTPKEEEQQAMQTLVSLPVAGTPTITIQELSTTS